MRFLSEVDTSTQSLFAPNPRVFRPDFRHFELIIFLSFLIYCACLGFSKPQTTDAILRSLFGFSFIGLVSAQISVPVGRFRDAGFSPWLCLVATCLQTLNFTLLLLDTKDSYAPAFLFVQTCITGFAVYVLLSPSIAGPSDRLSDHSPTLRAQHDRSGLAKVKHWVAVGFLISGAAALVLIFLRLGYVQEYSHSLRLIIFRHPTAPPSPNRLDDAWGLMANYGKAGVLLGIVAPVLLCETAAFIQASTRKATRDRP